MSRLDLVVAPDPRGRRRFVALAAVVLLPDIWPFHLVPVSLTPIAVTLVLVAGGLELRRLSGAPTAAAALSAAAPPPPPGRGGWCYAQRPSRGARLAEITPENLIWVMPA